WEFSGYGWAFSRRLYSLLLLSQSVSAGSGSGPPASRWKGSRVRLCIRRFPRAEADRRAAQIIGPRKPSRAITIACGAKGESEFWPLIEPGGNGSIYSCALG